MTELDDSQVARFSAYLDGEMSDEEVAAFEAELDADPQLQAEFDAFAETLSALSSLAAPAPDDFAEQVQRRIRRRSRGRYFGRDVAKPRFQVEVFAAVALLVLGMIALVGSPERFETLSAVEAGSGQAVDDGSGQESSDDEAPDGQVPPDDDGARLERDDGPRPVAPGRPLDRDDVRAVVRQPEPERATAVGASTGRMEGYPGRPAQRVVRRQEPQYIVMTNLPLEELVDEVRARVGRDRYDVGDDGVVSVTVPRDEYSAWVGRLGALGQVARFQQTLDPNEQTRTILLEPAP